MDKEVGVDQVIEVVFMITVLLIVSSILAYLSFKAEKECIEKCLENGGSREECSLYCIDPY